jgi:multidrug efflux pump subunit AcrA (membrane-fusion protein)
VDLDGADAAGLSSGAYVPLQVVLRHSKNVTLVPASSLVESPDRNSHVFIVQDGHLAARPVKVLGSSGNEVAVEGIQAGEQVVLSTFLGWAQLASGLKVEVMK